MKNINPCNTKSWKELQKHYEKIKHITIKNLFQKDKNRFLYFSKNFKNQILVDYSKNRITKDTIKKLLKLATECDLKNAIISMFHGKKINRTENRAVLHTALRNQNDTPIFINKKNIIPKIKIMLKKMEQICEKIINKKWKGYSNNKITDIVNIGIGGSDLGPVMVTEALHRYKNHLNIHFLSNIDGTHITEILKNLNPKNTIFLIASKSFSTDETITNAHSAKKWFLKTAKNTKYIEKHFIALTENIELAKNFGIHNNNIMKVWDWTGGRYSIWSTMGLSIALSLGFDNFKKLLKGANDMDQHFLNTNFSENLPIILALISIWYNNFFNTETEAILPYDQYMHKFPAYFQQGNMESNGKHIDRNGNIIQYQTSPIIWGEIGTNGQHSFYQLLHQGTKMVPCDFIAPAISHNPIHNHHKKLLSNFFAQTEALAFGKSKNTIKKELIQTKKTTEEIKYIIPFKTFEGNRPTNSILLKKITPYTLGALIALYEHKIFTQGVILNIYSFDQWGVELGKQLSNRIYSELLHNFPVTSHDNSTNNLINQYKLWRC
ncbi:Glucose-6-phosphate isomerase [Candidatus Westeberhardia cardiocondylae]|uniref:Glucose-6-phosphate isomerase n=1 Tax=Candidatus Westeberhardia cardiocondylae TaxID=1594731 RepID=A0A0H5BWJ2_9ENTR|nr:glucose-6-phosphate isomerase [Candidatus Westeberhardia cardiocondylae]CEN32087.1 Glucose-6-phosphate isomerase [Candidatus Westeberhardia cardiocondylae]